MNTPNHILSSLVIIVLLMSMGCSTKAVKKLQTENVFLITLDGLRWEELYYGADSVLIRTPEYAGDTSFLIEKFWAPTPEERRAKLMPFIWSTVAAQGQLVGNRKLDNKANATNKMWFSYPGYNEILSGFADDENISSNDKIPNPNTTVLEFINQQEGFQGKVAAFGSWDVFPYIINEERSGIPVNAGYENAEGSDLTEREIFLNELQYQMPVIWETVRLDAFTHHYAVEHIKKLKPRLVYIAYGETDDFAHGGKFDFYLKSARYTDQMISDLWELVQSMEEYRGKTTFIITTDHGRGDQPKENWKHHGYEDIPGSDAIWFAMIGPDIEPLGVVAGDMQFYQDQIAATVAGLLGFEFTNGGKAGMPIQTVFEEIESP